MAHLQAPPVPRRGRRSWLRAARIGGPGSAAALGPQRPIEPTLLRFYAEQAREWLCRELPERAWAYTARGSRITFERRYQLRFVPDSCRWLLLCGCPRGWSVPDLPGPCLSLVDWLRQIRHMENRRAKQEVMTFKRNRS